MKRILLVVAVALMLANTVAVPTVAHADGILQGGGSGGNGKP